MNKSNKLPEGVVAPPEHSPRVPPILKARYQDGNIWITPGVQPAAEVGFSAHSFPELAEATHEQLADFRISPEGEAILWREPNTAITLRRIAVELMGLSLTASAGAKGGSSTSKAKAVTARENGKKGGRPRKNPVDEPFSEEKLRQHLPAPAKEDLGSALN